MRYAKTQVKGVEHVPVVQVGSAWGASIDNVCFQVSGSLIRKLLPADLRAHVRKDVPGERLLSRCLCSIKCVPEFPVRLTGPTRGPLFELVRFS